MLNRILFIGSIGCCLLVSGCFESKIDRLRLDILAERLTLLEEWQAEVNENIRTLQVLVEAQKENVSIVSVTAVVEGYVVLLSDRRVLRIRNGEKGESGAAATVLLPIVSVRDSSDGHVYWTVNGELLRDAEGKEVRADGERGDKGDKGEQGEVGVDGIVPQVRINMETDSWEISVDEGHSWEPTGVKASGPQGETGDTGTEGSIGQQGPQGAWGEAVFAKDGVDVKEDYVEFILADGRETKIRIPKYREGSLVFPGGTIVRMPVGIQKNIPFTLSGGADFLVVEAAGDNGWLAEVVRNSENTWSGEIILTAPAEVGQGTVLVLLTDGRGGCWTYRLEVESYLIE